MTFCQKVDFLIRTSDYRMFESESNILKLIYIFYPLWVCVWACGKKTSGKRAMFDSIPSHVRGRNIQEKMLVTYIHANILICTYTQTMVHCILYQFIGILCSLMLKGIHIYFDFVV